MNYFDLKIYSEQQIGPFWFKKLALKEWFRLVKAEELTKVRRMVKKGININLKDAEGKTAFDYALKNHDIMMMVLLLSQGAAIKLSSKEGMDEFAREISDIHFQKREVLINNLEKIDKNLGLFLRKHSHSS